MSADFKPDDRVIVKPDRAESYILPLRGWVKKRRGATVISVGTLQGCKTETVLVRFDTARPPKRPGDYTLRMNKDELQHADERPAL
jgi:hypothetical protein